MRVLCAHVVFRSGAMFPKPQPSLRALWLCDFERCALLQFPKMFQVSALRLGKFSMFQHFNCTFCIPHRALLQEFRCFWVGDCLSVMRVGLFITNANFPPPITNVFMFIFIRRKKQCVERWYFEYVYAQRTNRTDRNKKRDERMRRRFLEACGVWGMKKRIRGRFSILIYDFRCVPCLSLTIAIATQATLNVNKFLVFSECFQVTSSILFRKIFSTAVFSFYCVYFM